MKKADKLRHALIDIKRQLKAGGAKLPYGVGVVIGMSEARAMVDALESLRWVNVYEDETTKRAIGLEYTTMEESAMIGQASKNVGYLETVGIIRLKDSQDEN